MPLWPDNDVPLWPEDDVPLWPDDDTVMTGDVYPLQVQRLTEMGFSDDSVRRALRLANNDVSLATNVLLQET